MTVQAFEIQADRVKKILVRGPNWVGDAMMCVPALDTVRRAFPDSEISLLVRPTVGELFVGHPGVDRVVVYEHRGMHAGWRGKFKLAVSLRREQYDLALLFQNAFEAALLGVFAGIPLRYGYATDGRRLLLTHPVAPPDGARTVHQVHYYMDMLKPLVQEASPPKPVLHVSPEEQVRAARLLQEGGIQTSEVVIGLNPGSVYGGAKRWLPERFAAVADRLIVELRQQDTRSVRCLIVGSPGEEELGQAVAQRMDANPLVLSGRTSLGELKAIIKRCHLFVTNDTGPMHVANALGVPVVAIFGPTDPVTTAPYNALHTIVRNPVRCSPCLLRECPIDHRCMTSISTDQVFQAAKGILAKRMVS